MPLQRSPLWAADPETRPPFKSSQSLRWHLWECVLQLAPSELGRQSHRAQGENASGKNSNHQNSSLPWLVVATNPPPPFLHLHFSISALLVALECGDAEATVLPPLRSDGRIQEARQQWKQRRERVSINRGCKLCGQGTESDVEAPWKVWAVERALNECVECGESITGRTQMSHLIFLCPSATVCYEVHM